MSEKTNEEKKTVYYGGISAEMLAIANFGKKTLKQCQAFMAHAKAEYGKTGTTAIKSIVEKANNEKKTLSLAENHESAIKTVKAEIDRLRAIKKQLKADMEGVKRVAIPDFAFNVTNGNAYNIPEPDTKEYIQNAVKFYESQKNPAKAKQYRDKL